jgi:hypothetical protein
MTQRLDRDFAPQTPKSWNLEDVMHARFAVVTSLIFAMTLAFAGKSEAQDNKTPHPSMAPIEQYLMDREAEISLARSAAPDSISREASVLVLTRNGYQTAVEGKNGFVCVVERSWTSPFEDPDFWNANLRAPVCLNAPAVRSYLPIIIKKTELAIRGLSTTQIADAITAAIGKKELPTPEANAMSYMMSKQGYLNSRDGNWLPHVMLFVPEIDPEAWGSGLKGAPLLGFKDTVDRLTLFFIPVGRWSDDTPSSLNAGGH